MLWHLLVKVEAPVEAFARPAYIAFSFREREGKCILFCVVPVPSVPLAFVLYSALL